MLSFLPVQRLRTVARVSKAWKYTANFRDQFDAAVACKTIKDLENFLKQVRLRHDVSAICCDISGMNVNGSQLQNCSRTLWGCGQVRSVTWKCMHYYHYHCVLAWLQMIFHVPEFGKITFSGELLSSQKPARRLYRTYVFKSPFLQARTPCIVF